MGIEDKIIDGKMISTTIREEIKIEVENLKKNDIIPGLAVILVGDNQASKVYVRNKKKACEQVGIYSEEYVLPGDTTQKGLLDIIDVLNKNDNISGILVQLPLPKHIDEKVVIESIDPLKDVDCFHPYNVGRLYTGDPTMMPCTPSGVIELLKRSNVEIQGKDCVVVGRSNIVGKPMGQLLLNENGTVTIAHSKTVNLIDICKRADIIVAAVGKANFITEDMVKDGVTVIDVGMNRVDGKLCGDVDFNGIKEKAAKITPVPGGVGPMTITMLLRNTITACKKQKNIV